MTICPKPQLVQILAVKKFSKDHEWIQVTEEGVTTFGFTHYGQDKYGEILMVEFQPADKDVKRGGKLRPMHRKRNICSVHSRNALFQTVQTNPTFVLKYEFF